VKKEDKKVIKSIVKTIPNIKEPKIKAITSIKGKNIANRILVFTSISGILFILICESFTYI